MKISLNEIKKYVDIPAEVSTDELVRLIGSRLVEVEGTEDWSAKYQGIYIVKVVECEAIPDTHLHRCLIDVGGRNISSSDHKLGRAALSASDEDGISSSPVQVVCGAPNVHKDMFAVWITPGSVVPATYGTDDEFRLDVRKLRGYESHGMLAGADELALGDDHSGIVEIDPDFAQPGDVFADKFGLNDIILDIENKSLTHRPDCFGIIGFAREVAGILGLKFKNPLPSIGQTLEAINRSHKPTTPICPISIANPPADICPAYEALVFDFSALPTRAHYLTPDDVFLFKSNMRPISPIVDATNLIMLQTGQPLHAFDYDKFVKAGGSEDPQIGVRLARKDEQLTLLDGAEVALTPNDIVITSSDVPVALAGAMGGASTAIDEHTTKIIVEVASFSLYNLRKTQMDHGIFSEAITRFTKGRPATDLAPATDLSLQSFQALGGRFAGQAFAGNLRDYQYTSSAQITITLTAAEVNKLLGSDYDADTIVKTLENVGFQHQDGGFIVPSWRTDIHIKEDLIEEVGRLLGYDNIPLTYPLRPFTGTTPDPLFTLKHHLRGILSDKLGAHEVLTYSFVSENLQQRIGEDPANSYKIVNSISPELQCFRQSLTPSLLSKVRANLKDGHKDFTLYEMNQISRKSDGLDGDQVPITRTRLAALTLGNYYNIKALSGALWRNLKITLPHEESQRADAQRTISRRRDAANVSSKYDTFDSATDYPYFEPKHAATLYIIDKNGEKSAKIGAFGEIRTSVLRQFKLEATPVSALELDLEALLPLLDAPESPVINQSKFPAVHRDFTFAVATEANFGQLRDLLVGIFTENQLLATVTPVSIYQKSPDSPTKHLSFHVKFAHPDHTLSSEEISSIIDTVTKKAAKLGAELI